VEHLRGGSRPSPGAHGAARVAAAEVGVVTVGKVAGHDAGVAGDPAPAGRSQAGIIVKVRIITTRQYGSRRIRRSRLQGKNTWHAAIATNITSPAWHAWEP
jgi:hypothetical protein